MAEKQTLNGENFGDIIVSKVVYGIKRKNKPWKNFLINEIINITNSTTLLDGCKRFQKKNKFTLVDFSSNRLNQIKFGREKKSKYNNSVKRLE